MSFKSHKVASVAFTAAAAAGLTGLTAGPALAAGDPWTVTPGGTFHAHNTTPAILVDHTKTAGGTPTSLSCPVSTVHVIGSAPAGTGLSGTNIAKITSAKFGNSSATSQRCKGPAGLDFTAQGSGYPWHLNAVSPVSANTVFGSITGIHADVASTGGVCTFHVSGSVSATYTNPPAGSSKGTLTVLSGSRLTIKSVNDCFGVVSNSDKAGFHGTFSVFSNAPIITHS